ncbi:Hsp20/alpha crystallin family protein [Pelomicrobium sp.]|jgi:HSP20 family protein|uniref:Hsp20/alpha crystallin family protein n=1 Tax=Pelomicrobium sp. TaxID=2815319 RepID=UPI002FDDD811
MLDQIKRVGKEIGETLGRAWENLAEGWRELLSRCGNALTQFSRSKESGTEEDLPVAYPRWGLLAGEVIERDQEILVRLELPGLEKEDCSVVVEDNTLVVRGEKRFDRDTLGAHYHIVERAYGRFERAIPLPRHVEAERAEATFRNGVLTVRLPKAGNASPRRIEIH